VPGRTGKQAPGGCGLVEESGGYTRPEWGGYIKKGNI